MKDKIGIIAVGQAGGNIGQLFEESGYSVLYLNTSQEDLDTLKNAKHKYHITGGEGCNKDRNKAKQLVIYDFDNIAEQIDEVLKCEILFVVFAAGGGTGSGAGPMLMDLLLDGSSRFVGAVTVLPAQTESIKAQINAYECFAELVQIEASAAVFVIDNNNGEKMQLNPQFVNSFNGFVDIPEKYRSDRGNIDTAEVMEALKAHGMAVVMQYGNSKMADILSSLNKTIYAQIEPDKRIKYITGAFDESVTNFIDLQKTVGIPVDIFRAYSGKDKAHLLLSGLSYPKTRLDVIHEYVSENKERIMNNLNAGTIRLDSDINFLSAPAAPVQSKTGKQQSRQEIMSRYLRK